MNKKISTTILFITLILLSNTDVFCSRKDTQYVYGQRDAVRNLNYKRNLKAELLNLSMEDLQKHLFDAILENHTEGKWRKKRDRELTLEEKRQCKYLKIRVLMELGVDPNHQPSWSDFTAFELAKRLGNVRALRILEGH